MKQLIGSDIGMYVFSPSTKSITILNLQPIKLENILLITNATAGVIIYNFADASLNATIINNVITLEYDTTAMSTTDALQIYVDIINEPSDSVPIPIIPSLPGQQGIMQAMPVALANEQFFDLQSPASSVFNPAVGFLIAMQDCIQYRSIALQIDTTAGISAGVVSFEGSNELDASNNWSPVTLLDSTAPANAGVTSVTLSANTNRYFIGGLNFRYFRARVSTTVAGGAVSCSAVYRMVPFSPPVNHGVNMVQWGGTAVTGAAIPGVNTSQYGGAGVVTGGVAGVPSVGGNVAQGTAVTANPVTIGGVDAANIVRRMITDSFGQLITRQADGSSARQAPAEMLEYILFELRTISFYLKELPLMLSMPNAFFKEESSDFTNIPEKL